MTKTITCPHCGFEGPILSFDDALSQDAWRNAVSDGETTLGFADWLVEQMQNALVEGVFAVETVVENWASGDLAGAVNAAEAWADDVKETYAIAPAEMAGDEAAEENAPAQAEAN